MARITPPDRFAPLSPMCEKQQNVLEPEETGNEIGLQVSTRVPHIYINILVNYARGRRATLPKNGQSVDFICAESQGPRFGHGDRRVRTHACRAVPRMYS